MASALSSKASLFVGGGGEGAVLNDTGMPEPAAAQEVCFVLQNGHNEMSSRDIPQDFMSFTPTSKTGRGFRGGLVSLFAITMAALSNMRLRLLSL